MENATHGEWAMRIQTLVGTALLCAALLAASCGDDGSHTPVTPTAPAPAAAGTGALAVTPSLSFGSVDVGQSATRVLHISNNGRSDVSWTAVNSTSDAFTASPTAGTVPTGETRAVEVTFAPTSPGDFSATITVVSNAPPGANTTSVTGRSAGREIALSGRLEFGDVPVGQSARGVLLVSNTGNATLTFTSVTSSDRAFTASPTSGTVPAGGSQAITVVFAPGRVGSYRSVITVTSDAAIGTNAVDASGSGVPAPDPPPSPAPPSSPSPALFTLVSTSFANGAPIPARHALCPATAGNLSPALAWSNAPSNTRSFAIIVDDPTAKNFTHWVLFDIPASVTSLGEGGTAGTAGSNDFPPPRAAYDGPCPPPPTGTHTYNFTVYALSVPSINVAPGATRNTVQSAFAPFVISSARISGTYSQ
jgi:hypothetical protein